MGWKTFKEAFGIKHIVQVTADGIQIGSPYVSDIVTINPETGKIKVDETFPGFLKEYYPNLVAATPEAILAAIKATDAFSAAIVVYTERDGKIVECLCETPGYPNVTHDGQLMHNGYSPDKDYIVQRTKAGIASSIKWIGSSIERAEQELDTLRQRLSKEEADLAALNRDYPSLEALES